MSRRIPFFLTLWFALLQIIQGQKCSICGADNIQPGNTNSFYNIRYFGTYSCPNLYSLGQQGKIPGYICGIIKSRLNSACQCGMNPQYSDGGGSAPFTVPPGLNLPPSWNNYNLQTPRPTPAPRPRPTQPRPPPSPTRRPTRPPTRNPTRPPTRMPTPRPTPGPSPPPTTRPTPLPTTRPPTPAPTPKPTRVPTEAPTGRYTRKERTASDNAKSALRLSNRREGDRLKELRLQYGFGRNGGRELQEPAEMMQEEEAVAEEIAEMEEASS